MDAQLICLQEGECKFNLPLKLRKSFQVIDNNPKDMPPQFQDLKLLTGKYFWGYANVGEVDMQGDLFPISTLEDLAPGLTEAPYNKIFLFHNYEDIAIGTIVATAVDSRGLLILAQLNEAHDRAQEVWSSILNGSLDGLSMGGSFVEVESYYDENYDMVVTVAKKATASEVSLTSIPVNGGSLLMGAFQKARKILKEKDPKIFKNGKIIKSVPDLTQSKEGADFQKPFAGYKDFKDCVNKNGDKSNPEAYCATIMKKVEKSENRETFKYHKNQDNCMTEKKDFSEAQKVIYEKAISDGKTEEDALKLVMAEQKQEASESVNQDLTGNDSKANPNQNKVIKKSVETQVGPEETKPTENPEKPEEKSEEKPEEKKEDPEEPKETESEEKSEPEKTEESIDYEKAYKELKKNNEDLRLQLEKFTKSLEKAGIRKSLKTPEEPVPKISNSTDKNDKTPFLSWLKN